MIISEADRLQHLVDKILAPYRQLYHPVPTNVHEILERVRLLVQSEFPEGLKVVRDYDISVPEMMADRGQLTQISLNLMRNAAEALSEQIAQGTACITLKTRVVHHVQVGQSFCRTALNIHVIDNGEGIPKELADSIFIRWSAEKNRGAASTHWFRLSLNSTAAVSRSAVKPAVPISASCFPYRYEKCLDRGR